MRKEGKKVSKNHPIISKKINKSLKISINQGATASASNSFGLSYFSPFAIALNASATQIGILESVINLSQGIVQLTGPKFIEKFKRKKVVIFSEIIEFLLLIPIILCAYLFYIGTTNIVWILILFIGLFYIARATIHPAWFSWMGSLAPKNKRGDYFSKRNKIAGLVGVISLAIAGLILNYFSNLGVTSQETTKYTLLGFVIIFLIAMFFRAISIFQMKRQYEPKLITKKKDFDSFKKFLKESKNNSFGKFVIFRGFFAITIGIAAPFWTVYLLKDLNFSYLLYMGVTISTALFHFVFFPIWGKISDKYGNIKVIKISIWAIALIPFTYILSSFFLNQTILKIWIFIVPSLLSGIGWAGFNLCANNYVYDAIKQQKRTHSVSYMNLIVGIGLFIGSLIGTALTSINIFFMNSLLFIFLISGILRYLVIFKFTNYLKEVRHVKEYSNEYLIREFSPFKGVIKEVHNLEHVVKKEEHHI